jgi:hypothetical protein
VLAWEVPRLCDLLVVSRLACGVCFAEAGLPVPSVAGSLSSSGSGAWMEALIVTMEVVYATVRERGVLLVREGVL